MLALAATLPAQAAQSAGQNAAGDVFDQFFRYTDSEHKAVFEDMPGETVDPFTGTLRIVQQDLVLPGKAGLDVRIVRAYSSKIWGRADALDAEPLLAEKEHSVLGYGWTFHMGRLRDPYASGASGMCSGEFPVYEAQDGTTRVFYPVPSPAGRRVFLSKDYWRMEQNCSALGGSGACVWSSGGVRYEFSSSYDNQFFSGTTPVWPVSAIVDPFGNRVSVSYLPQTGAVSGIIDTYRRTIAFGYAYDPAEGNARLRSMTVNGNVYSYEYTKYVPSETGGAGRIRLPGAKWFLTHVQPPIGPGYYYQYGYDRPVVENQYALTGITYPAGGSTSYQYSAVNFFTGRDIVPFAVVTKRSLSGRGVPAGSAWNYSYVSPGPGDGMHITTITRPDGSQDTFAIYGFGYVAGRRATGYTWMVGLTAEIARANRSQVETLTWDPRTSDPLSTIAFYSAPVYSSSCGVNYVWDTMIASPALAEQVIVRDGASYRTTYSAFDKYGQAQAVSETGWEGTPTSTGQQSSRVTRNSTWTFFSAPTDGAGQTLNLVRERPSTRHVCVGSECFDDAWTYNGPFYARDTETLSGVTTTFGYHGGDAEGAGNLRTVTNALGQTLTLSGYGAGYGTPTSINFNYAFTASRTASWEGWVLSETNGRNYTTKYSYDGVGRLVSVTPPGNNDVTRYTYAADGSWVNLTRGRYVKLSNLDGLGRVTGTSDSEGTLTSTRHDNMGNVRFKSYPYDATSGEVGDLLDVDGLGRITKQTQAYRPSTNSCATPGACTMSRSYAANCTTEVVQRSASDNLTTTRCSTSFGSPEEQRLTTVRDASGTDWRYAYGAHGELERVAAPSAQGDRRYDYDPVRHFLLADTSTEAGAVAYGRNAIGQMTSRRDARGVTAAYRYDDPLSRLRTIIYQNGSSDDVTRNYDNANNVTYTASVNGGAFDYAYDELNRVTSQTWSRGGRKYTTLYQYNSAGCMQSMTYPSGLMLSFTCDTANRVTSVSAGASAIVGSILYHPSGQVKAMTYGNGRSTAIVYDDRARAKTVTSPGVLGLGYGYDGNSNVVSFQNSAVANSLRTMTYDRLDRLLTSAAPYQWGTAVYDYDALGNRILKSVGSATVNFAYDSQTNRLVTARGWGAPRAPMTFTWDLPGRLASSSDGTTYRYDVAGRRVQKTDPSGTVLYHYDAGGRLVAETLADGTRLREYIYLGNKLVAVSGCVEGLTTSSCSGLQWYHTDTLGSVLARTDATGAVVAQMDYEPWGEQWTNLGVLGDRQYNGRVYDAGTGFHDYGARLYWPQIGRFVSADSVTGNPADPRSLNRYSYVLNNPYKYVDPSGRDPVRVRILEDTRLSGEYLVRSGLGGPTVGDLSEQGLLRDALANGGARLDGMQQSEQALWEVEFGLIRAFPALAGVGIATTVNPGAGAGTRQAEEGAGAKGLGNPFKGKSARQVDKMCKDKGFDPRGPDPAGGKGGYVNPQTGRSYHIDEANSFGEPPHVDVNRPRGYQGPLDKKKYEMGSK